MQHIDARALIQIKGARQHLTAQQYRTLKGQVLAGNPDGAMKGLRKIMQQKGRQKNET
jgi:hypothetical protein